MSYRKLFEKFNKEEIRYVIMRRYDDLPESTIEGGTDVDILIESSQFNLAINISNNLGFNPNEPSGSSRLRVYRMALSKPGKAVNKLVYRPKESLKKILLGSEPEWDNNPRHENVQLHRGSQIIELHNNLAYKSPMKGTKIPVNPDITEGMLKRRNKCGCFFIPSPPDELAHLIPHCVFNKDGNFPPYYEDRCIYLFTQVQSDEKYDDIFTDILDKIFFKASGLVYEMVSKENYSNIRKELKKFSGY